MEKHLQIISREHAKAFGMSKFFSGNSCKRNHVEERFTTNGSCCECKREYYIKNKEKMLSMSKANYKEKSASIKEKRREKYKDNKSAVAARKRRYGEKNKQKISIKKQEYYNKNREALLKKSKDWGKANRELRNKTQKAFRSTPYGKVSVFMRDSLKRVLNGDQKEGETDSYMGYGKSDLVSHIERQFLKGMTWENYGEWHIDHITPIKVFFDEGERDPSVINSLANLRPVWATYNLSKGSRPDTLL